MLGGCHFTDPRLQRLQLLGVFVASLVVGGNGSGDGRERNACGGRISILSWFNQNRHLDQVISDPQGKIESMNDKKPRRHFDPAVKLQMIEMVRNQGLSVAQVCSEMKLSRSVLSRWLNQFDQEQAGRPGKGIPLTAEQRRICELEMQVRQLQSDNALLKKASAFFARELQ